MTSLSDQSVWLVSPLSSESTPTSASYFRTKFELPNEVTKAVLRFSALGIVEPWINGVRVNDDYFTPGWSDYRKRAYVCRYEVTEQLEVGENCLGIVLADGWAGAAFGPKGHEASHAPQTMFVAELQLTFADGTQQVIGSDVTWKVRRGPVVKNSLYHGETYDARKAMPDWASSSSAERGWKSVASVETPQIELTEKACPPVRVTETLAVVELRKESSGWIADFGQNLVGVVRIKLKDTRAGQKVILKFAEMLNEDGSLYLENLRDAEATDCYICKGSAEESYQPHFTFHGFRYVQIEGVESDLSVEDLEACVLHNDLAPLGTFKTSNAIVNQLQDCIRWGQRGNFLEAPTDCPQRDERLGWSGDAQVFVDTACFNYDCEGFYRQWMDAMRDGQREDGAFPDVAPDILGWHGNAGWGDAGIIVPHAVWLHTGATTIIEENWQAMERYLRFLKDRAKQYIQPETVYGDWLAVDAVKPQWGPTPKDLIGTAYYARDAQLMARMADALERTAAAKRYSQLAARITAAFQQRFITAEGLVLGDTQTSYLMALAFDLVPEHLIEAAGARLVEKIEAREWHLSTGFLGTPLLNPVLSKIGRSDVAYKLLLQESYPSWLYPIKNGATTMWERWNSWTREDGFGPVEMNSFNHYAYGAIGEWLYQTVGGIAPCPEAPGYTRAILSAQPSPDLKRASCVLKTRVGTYRSKWTIKRKNLHWDLAVPESGEGRVVLPATPWSKVKLNGKSVPSRLKHTDQRNAMCLPVGKHRIEIENCPLAHL
ncbi:family 78 glycoside hydrolase catalytic domain [Coraliomargarita sp. SDUM461004]|uniref:alpha-L-rhamnosidase n=1 Tax=Thalassobacterium sedimentorum TaxID=3041258 RepID=A0ABU1AM58_9BACT|nr:family 78 glycoside hydrolase catalytic domain [Coraliomargarita sp. SDUM461004]MDQ8195879.1 family 78 glycoside hydrolase catalytic domain [Coraliomargarita sp. SDUM461004]